MKDLLKIWLIAASINPSVSRVGAATWLGNFNSRVVSWISSFKSKLGINRISTSDEAAKKAVRTLTITSIYLREPLKDTGTLLRANSLFLKEVERHRNCQQDSNYLKRYINEFEFPQEGQLATLYQQDRRSRIIASFHYGDFVYGLHKLYMAQPKGICSKVLSQMRYTETFLSNMRAGFGSAAAGIQTQLLLENTNSVQLSAILRTQPSTLLMFADLPAGFGQTVRVKFLGRYAWFPCGIAILALANRVPILPVSCCRSKNTNSIVLAEQIEPIVLEHEKRDEAVQRITQRIVSHLEMFILQQPQFWRYLTVLSQYFQAPKGITANAE